jgi:hypothetical protein
MVCCYNLIAFYDREHKFINVLECGESKTLLIFNMLSTGI